METPKHPELEYEIEGGHMRRIEPPDFGKCARFDAEYVTIRNSFVKAAAKEAENAYKDALKGTNRTEKDTERASKVHNSTMNRLMTKMVKGSGVYDCFRRW